ncbi:DUF4890 domain-containing protein [Desertivirga brevis]|uniref:DUF4890 domain-containing protein n=1 Tax=Desertivirga brevis TaxID=2810310 RepID=UPI001A97841C|nr:DUF4890 domain-containing protein [Pedobacter sp. SYSU D00873]
MKKLILTALLFAGLATAGFSQERQGKHQREHKTPEQRAQHVTDVLDKKLSLNDKQKNQIYKINLERAKEMEKLHSSGEKRDKKDFEQAKKLFQESDNKISKVLNNDQRKQYEDLKAQRREHAKDRRGEFRKKYRDGKRGEAENGK